MPSHLARRWPRWFLPLLMAGALVGCSTAARPIVVPALDRSRQAGSVDVAVEESRPGTADWQLQRPATPQVLAGFTTPASSLPGGPVAVHLRSRAPRVLVEVFRAGWYGGKGARRVWKHTVTVPPPAPAVLLDAATRTWQADWPADVVVSTRGWAPGGYLIRATSAQGQTWIPFTLRSPTFRGRVVVLSADTTWQAYNAWGGASLYHGRDGTMRSRAYAVSFDRPYAYGNGAADFVGNERPLIALAERMRLPLAFAADTDLDAAPGLLDGARAILSPGHDEYWSTSMRDQLEQARAGGTNLAFFGANAIYRHIRLGPLPSGPNRLETNYKDPRLDPLSRTHPADATGNWPSGAPPQDGDELTGGQYRCNPVHADMILTEPSSWLLRGLGLYGGERLPGLIGSEYDRLPRAGVGALHLFRVASSPVRCHGQSDHADLVYYTTPSGAVGLDVGTSSWVCVLARQCEYPVTDLDVRVVTSVTTRVLLAFARGPAARRVAGPDSVGTLASQRRTT